VFRLLCLNNVIKTDIYTKNIFNLPCKTAGWFKKDFYCLNLDLLDLRINLIAMSKRKKLFRQFRLETTNLRRLL